MHNDDLFFQGRWSCSVFRLSTRRAWRAMTCWRSPREYALTWAPHCHAYQQNFLVHSNTPRQHYSTLVPRESRRQSTFDLVICIDNVFVTFAWCRTSLITQFALKWEHFPTSINKCHHWNMYSSNGRISDLTFLRGRDVGECANVASSFGKSQWPVIYGVDLHWVTGTRKLTLLMPQFRWLLVKPIEDEFCRHTVWWKVDGMC